MGGPLEGIRVLSFCRMLSGPYASMLLSDLGAEVVKIEWPGIGDLPRHSGPFVDGLSSYFLSVNRGKKSVTVDLKNETAPELIFNLIQRADILLENFRPGVMEKLGYGYPVVSEHSPQIIYASISGFGQTGPYALKPAYDMIAQGMGGVVSLTGEPGQAPARVGYSIGDIGAALYAVIAITSALYEREKSGRGQHIDVSMLDSQVALCENACARYFATGEVPGPTGSRHPLFTPFEVFPTQDGNIVVIAFRDDHWETFCRTVGREAWIEDDRFKSNGDRLKHHREFASEMGRLMRSRSTKAWLELLEARGVICGPVHTIDQVVNDPHIREREMVLEVENSQGKRFNVVGTPMKFSRTPCAIAKASPELGEHTDEVLNRWGGLSEEQIERLRKTKAI